MQNYGIYVKYYRPHLEYSPIKDVDLVMRRRVENPKVKGDWLLKLKQHVVETTVCFNLLKYSTISY